MKKQFPSTILHAFGLLLISLLISSPFIFLLDGEFASGVEPILFISLLALVIFIFSYIVNRKREKHIIPGLREKGSRRKVFTFALIIVLIFQAFANPVMVSQISELMSKFSFMPKGSVDQSLTLPIILSTILLGPVLEEYIFRKVIFTGFLGNYSLKKAIIYSSIIFALIHFLPSQLPGAFLLGVLLAYVYFHTGKLIYPIILHITANLIGTAPKIIQQEASIAILPEKVIVQLILLVIGVAASLLLAKKMIASAKELP